MMFDISKLWVWFFKGSCSIKKTVKVFPSPILSQTPQTLLIYCWFRVMLEISTCRVRITGILWCGNIIIEKNYYLHPQMQVLEFSDSEIHWSLHPKHLFSLLQSSGTLPGSAKKQSDRYCLVKYELSSPAPQHIIKSSISSHVFWRGINFRHRI